MRDSVALRHHLKIHRRSAKPAPCGKPIKGDAVMKMHVEKCLSCQAKKQQCYSDSEMADSSPKRTGPTNANDGKAFARPVEEANPLIIKRQDDILEDPLSIKDNVKEEARNSLDN